MLILGSSICKQALLVHLTVHSRHSPIVNHGAAIPLKFEQSKYVVLR